MQRILFISVPLLILFYMGCKEDNPTDPGTPTSNFLVTIENVAGSFTYSASGVFNTPVGAGAPAAIGPGESYEFFFDAAPGSLLSFATMFVQSNDFFYAPGVFVIHSGDNPLFTPGDPDAGNGLEGIAKDGILQI